MDQGDYLTLEELYRVTEHVVELPELSRAAGRPRRVTVRPISMAEYLTLFPLDPPEAESWPALPDLPDLGTATAAELEAAQVARRAVRKDRLRLEMEWLRARPLDDQQRHQQERVDVTFKVIALAALQPAFTVEAARRLGPDAAILFERILVESGILPRPPEAAAADPARADDAP